MKYLKYKISKTHYNSIRKYLNKLYKNKGSNFTNNYLYITETGLEIRTFTHNSNKLC